MRFSLSLFLAVPLPDRRAPAGQNQAGRCNRQPDLIRRNLPAKPLFHLYTEHIDHFLSDEELRAYLEAEEEGE